MLGVRVTDTFASHASERNCERAALWVDSKVHLWCSVFISGSFLARSRENFPHPRGRSTNFIKYVPFGILPSVSRCGTLARFRGNEGPRRRIILAGNGASRRRSNRSAKIPRNLRKRTPRNSRIILDLRPHHEERDLFSPRWTQEKSESGRELNTESGIRFSNSFVLPV